MYSLAKIFLYLAISLLWTPAAIAQQDLTESLKELARKGIAVHNEARKSGIIANDEQIIDKAITDYDAEVIARILDKKRPDLKYRRVYAQTLKGLDTENPIGSAEANDWLVECASGENKHVAHKCTISLGFLAILDDNNNLTLDWSLKSLDIANSFGEQNEDYWYAQYQSNELLSIAFILDGNLDGAINAGTRLIDSASKTKVKFGAYHFINNLAYLARTEIGPEAAIEILKEVLPTLDTVPIDGQEIMYYALGKNYTYIGDYEAANNYYSALEKIVQRPDIKRAYLANTAYVGSMLGNFEQAKQNAAEARVLFENNLENSFGLNILVAEKNVAISEGHLSEALQIDEEIDRIDELLQEQAISANRVKLSKSLEIQNEKNQRETDKLQFDAELSEQQAKSRSIQLFLSTAALIFLLGLAFYIFRSYKREQKLNTEIQTKNNELEESNYQLESAHDTLQRTFDELQVAHKQALAGQDAKEKFIGVIGHELRTPLNPIINLAGVLEDSSQNPREKALLTAIKNAGKRLHIIVENMLAISSSDENSKIYVEPIDVVENTTTILREFGAEIASKVTELKRTGETLKVNVLKSPKLNAQQYCNKVIYRSVVRNLFDNALKFTRSGVVVIELRPRPDGSGFVFVIRDSGAGMETSKISDLMEPFQQAEMDLGRAYEGAGLGLTVVQKYCEQLGAKLSIESTVNVGTKITIDFPTPAYQASTGKLLKAA